MRNIASHPAARGLADDAAVLSLGDTKLILTHDMLVEGVHFLPDDPPQDVAWKLVSVNLSDLAAKGAKPAGVLIGYGLTVDASWDQNFVEGLETALSHYGVPLLGGDTVKQPQNNARALGLTAIGTSDLPNPPARSGAKAGDILYVTGRIGDGWAGLQLLLDNKDEPASLINAYRRPTALVDAGRALAPAVHAMMDVSDGLLIDAQRMAGASALALTINLGQVPLSTDYIAVFGDNKQHRVTAAIGGDDYQLLMAAPPNIDLPINVTPVGQFDEGTGLSLTYHGENVTLPEKLGYMH